MHKTCGYVYTQGSKFLQTGSNLTLCPHKPFDIPLLRSPIPYTRKPFVNTLASLKPARFRHVIGRYAARTFQSSQIMLAKQQATSSLRLLLFEVIS